MYAYRGDLHLVKNLCVMANHMQLQRLYLIAFIGPSLLGFYTWKGLNAGKDWKQKEKGVAENEMVKLWEIVEDKEPSVLQSIRSQRVRHDLVSEQ